MDDEGLRERLLASMFGAWRLIAESSEGGRTIDRLGLLACIVPATPGRSVFNSVIYSDPAALAESLAGLGPAYDEAGIEAWTVWVPESDSGSAGLLEAAGHRLDAAPRGMAMELAGAEQPDMAGIEWSREGDVVALARINDAAYGDPPGTFEAALGGLPRDRLHLYYASVDGEVSAAMMTLDFDGDTEVAFVATTPAARGRGLATALMRQSLWDARERGCETATLQATRLGAPVYQRVGFRDLGALQMWERRRG
jgi:GNAT superfamily N-acetyltransferase